MIFPRYQFGFELACHAEALQIIIDLVILLGCCILLLFKAISISCKGTSLKLHEHLEREILLLSYVLDMLWTLSALTCTGLVIVVFHIASQKDAMHILPSAGFQCLYVIIVYVILYSTQYMTHSSISPTSNASDQNISKVIQIV